MVQVNRDNENFLTFEKANELFVYDPDTGCITNKVNRASMARKGGVAGCKYDNGYLQISVKRRRFRAHRLAWLLHTGEWPSGLLDHVNRDRSDNKISNLREASSKDNAGNSKLEIRNTSGYKGVFSARKKWRARISIGDKMKSLGSYDTKEQAAEAYAAAARLHFGEFANPAKSDAVP